MLSPREITPELSAERIGEALKFCARNASSKKVWISEQAVKLDIDEDTFASYYSGRRSPSLVKFLKMATHFGPGFASYVLEPTGLTAVRTDDKAIVEGTELVKLVKQLAPKLDGAANDIRRFFDEQQARQTQAVVQIKGKVS